MFLCIHIIGLLVLSAGNSSVSNDISYEIRPSHIYAGQPFTILLKLTKNRESYPFCFYPLKIDEKNSDVNLEFKGITTYESQDRTEIEVNIVGVSNEPGSYILGPFTLPYLILTSDIEKELNLGNTGIIPTSNIYFPEISITVASWKKTFFLLMSITGCFLIITSLVIIWLLRQWIAKRKQTTTISDGSNLYELLHIARGYRLDGDIYKFLKTLTLITNNLKQEGTIPEIENLIDKLQTLSNEVGYKGKSVSETELDWYWKEVEKLVRIRKKNSSGTTHLELKE